MAAIVAGEMGATMVPSTPFFVVRGSLSQDIRFLADVVQGVSPATLEESMSLPSIVQALSLRQVSKLEGAATPLVIVDGFNKAISPYTSKLKLGFKATLTSLNLVRTLQSVLPSFSQALCGLKFSNNIFGALTTIVTGFVDGLYVVQCIRMLHNYNCARTDSEKIEWVVGLKTINVLELFSGNPVTDISVQESLEKKGRKELVKAILQEYRDIGQPSPSRRAIDAAVQQAFSFLAAEDTAKKAVATSVALELRLDLEDCLKLSVAALYGLKVVHAKKMAAQEAQFALIFDKNASKISSLFDRGLVERLTQQQDLVVAASARNEALALRKIAFNSLMRGFLVGSLMLIVQGVLLAGLIAFLPSIALPQAVSYLLKVLMTIALPGTFFAINLASWGLARVENRPLPPITRADVLNLFLNISVSLFSLAVSIVCITLFLGSPAGIALEAVPIAIAGLVIIWSFFVFLYRFWASHRAIVSIERLRAWAEKVSVKQRGKLELEQLVFQLPLQEHRKLIEEVRASDLPAADSSWGAFYRLRQPSLLPEAIGKFSAFGRDSGGGGAGRLTADEVRAFQAAAALCASKQWEKAAHLLPLTADSASYTSLLNKKQQWVRRALCYEGLALKLPTVSCQEWETLLRKFATDDAKSCMAFLNFAKAYALLLSPTTSRAAILEGRS